MSIENTQEDNKLIVRNFFERALNGGDLGWLDQVIAPSFGTADSGPHPSGATGPERAHAMVQHYRRAFPDIRFTVEDLLAEGDRVVVRVSFRGTHRGEFMGVPATGRVVTGSGVEMAILAGGRITTTAWQFHDELGLLRQFGVLPPHGHALEAGGRYA